MPISPLREETLQIMPKLTQVLLELFILSTLLGFGLSGIQCSGAEELIDTWYSGIVTAGGKGFGQAVLDLTFYMGSICGHSLRDKTH